MPTETNGYPKRFMSISELAKMGLSEPSLREWVYAKGFPSQRASDRPNSKWLIDTYKLDAWFIKRGLKKATHQPASESGKPNINTP